MFKYYILLLTSIVLNSASLVLLKKGALLHGDIGANLFSIRAWFHLIFNPFVITSIFFFVCGTITWIISLTKIDLSLAYPSVSISYLIIAIISHYLFGEAIPFNRWLGIIIIMVGITVMYKH